MAPGVTYARVAGTHRSRNHQVPPIPAEPCPDARPLLKTPTAQLATNGGSQHPDKRRAGGHGPTLADEVEHLLPGGAHHQAGPDDIPGPWGPYAAAITRWEQRTGRAAPSAVNERGRLAPEFVEWMMGLEQAWVTGVPDLSRAAQLKALGNGVVPAQARDAIALLLARTGGAACRA
ncbi:DNA (cytosine-5-)-methyltransferase [Streptomyces sp. Edi4]|uniref:DNA (cytosine-5-)-methyltransferase n=1 Tax=Streptomyces sp. Edi4 TaxID=3162527 RepID=UPI0033062806